MKKEIERKFLILRMPEIVSTKKIRYERYFLEIKPDFELRIQKRANAFELEQKFRKSELLSGKEKRRITESEFKRLKLKASKVIIRDSYPIKGIKEATVKVYSGVHEGLVRAEFEFKSLKDAKNFSPPFWCGLEITESDLGKDSKLIKLNKSEFKRKLKGVD